MGLSVDVGVLADLIENDLEGAAWEDKVLKEINRVLAENGLPPHHEPKTLPPLRNRASLLGFPYSFLHYLRRAFAYAAEYPGWKAEPFPEADDPTDDPVLDKQMDRLRSHLLCHSDCEGFYVPIDFPDVIIDEEDRIPGGVLGSSFALRGELIAVAPALGIAMQEDILPDAEAERINKVVDKDGPLWIELGVWLCLFEAARLSIEHGTAISFG